MSIRKLAILSLMLAVFAAFGVLQPVQVHAQAVSFDKDLDGLNGASVTNPTSIEFGPDERLYVSQQNGIIKAFTVQRIGEDNYAAIATETINIIQQQVPNHNDDGAPNSTTNRQVTGIVLAGTATNPVIYVSSSDWRIAVGNDVGLDTNSGVISRLTCTTAIVNNACQNNGWEKVDIIRGLPRSEENHSTNGMDIDEATNTLFIMQGGHANKGAPSNNFSGTPEYFLSAALLAVDLDVINSMPVYTDPRTNTAYVYDLPTLNDPSRADIDNTSPDFPYTDPTHPLHNASIDPGDPFGGNNGANMAITEPGGPLQIYSPGYRNAYDIVFTENGRLYTSDNGPNGGWGGMAIFRADNGTLLGNQNQDGNNPSNPAFPATPDAGGYYCTNELNEADSGGHGDALHFIEGPGYYGGHVAPIRAFPAQSGIYIYEEINSVWEATATYQFGDLLNGVTGYFNTTLDISDYPDDPIQCWYGAKESSGAIQSQINIIDSIGSSTNGITEYTATNFDGAMQGNIITASYNGNLNRYDLNEAGDDAVEYPGFLSGFGSQPLDVTAQGDDDIFPGTIWAATYGADNITIFEPNDFTLCEGTDDPALDEDGDGYTNADEIDNGTDPCSGGSQPNDFDNDLVSDLNDTDDDGDGIADGSDAFAIDPDNGTTTNLPINYPFWNNDPGTGFFGLGFTGLMTHPNGTTNYLTQFNPENLAFGGAAGKASVEVVTDGDAHQNTNTQQNAFQFGINVDQTTPPFYVQSELESPYFFNAAGNQTSPQNWGSYGIFIGTGDQNNFLKLVLRGNGGTNGFQVLTETNGSTSQTNWDVTGVLDVAQIELYLFVNPSTLSVQPKYSLDGGNTMVNLGSPIEIPASWFAANDNKGLAVGIISTSNGGMPEFGAIWDFINVEYTPSDAAAIVEVDTNDLNGSTFSNSSFKITNTSQSAINITNVTFDLDTGMLPDIVFDPNGSAGDGTSKDLTANNGSGTTTGLVDHTFSDAHDGGFYGLSIDFNGFAPGEMLEFGLDIDPTSIKGGSAPGPNESGSVSGLELTGATVTIEFSDGTSFTGNLFRQAGDNGDSINTFSSNLLGLPTPTIADSVVDAPATVANPNRTIEISGAPNADVRLLHVEAGMFVADLTGPNAGVGFDVDAFEANSVIVINEYTVTTNASGNGSVNVTLTDSNAEAGFNYFIAAVDEGTDTTGPTSNVLVLEFDVDANTPPSIVQPYDQTGFEGQTVELAIQYSDDDEDNVSFEAANLPAGLSINENTGVISGTIANGAAANSPYNVAITGDDGVDTTTVNFVWDVVNPTPIYRVRAMGATITATDNGPDWVTAGGTGAQIFDDFAVNTGNSSTHNITNRHSSLPAYVPTAIFALERWDPPATPEMEWTFDVTPGEYLVRLYLSNGFSGTSAVGARVFDIQIEGQTVEEDFGAVAAFGHQVGGMREHFVTVNDNTLNILFIHEVENPNVNGIEILTLDPNVQSPILVDSISNQFSFEGDPVDFFVSASGGEGNLAFSATGLPAGVDIEPTNGHIFGAIAAGALANSPYNVAVTVDDSDENSDDAVTVNFTWTINEPIQPGSVVYRVNAGGPEIAANDGGIPWSADQSAANANGTAQTGTPSPYLVLNANTTDTTFGADFTGVNTTGVPDGLFPTERYSQTANPNNMSWEFPVADGDYVVNLYVAEVWTGAQNPGARIFSVEIEDNLVLENFDITAAVGWNTVTRQSFNVTVTDGFIDIDFLKTPTNNPKISAIEIIAADDSTPDLVFNPATLPDYTLEIGQMANPSIAIETSDQSALPGDLAVTSSEDWVMVMNDQGSYSLMIMTANLTAGDYSATVTASGTGYNNATLEVNLTVTEPVEPGQVLYRVNVGGPEIPVIGGGIPWSKDEGNFPNVNNSPYLAANSTGGSLYNGDAGSAYPGPIIMTHPSIPASAPALLFNTERYDVADAPEMLWQFPVAAGTTVEVRLFFAELFAQINNTPENPNSDFRIFDVSVEGSVPAAFDDIDPYGTAGPKGALMLSTVLTVTDGTLDIEFIHGQENPALKGIEIIQVDTTTEPTLTLVSPQQDEVVTGPTVTVEWTSQGGDPSDYEGTGLGDHLHIRWNDQIGIFDERTPVYDELTGSLAFEVMQFAQNDPKLGPVYGENTLEIVMADPFHVEYETTRTVITFTIEEPTGDDASLTGNVTLQGRDAAPNAGWEVQLTVDLYAVGASTPSYSFTPTTDQNGQFTVTGIAPGEYEVAVKNSHTLQVVETITLAEGANTQNFGTLAEGDVNDSNSITLEDFSLLAIAFNTGTGDANFNPGADLNNDSIVGLEDFSLLAANFNINGENPSGVIP